MVSNLRKYIRVIILESMLRDTLRDPKLVRYLKGLAQKADNGDLTGAVKGLVMGSHAKQAREFVFQQAHVINWNYYPVIKQTGVIRMIPRKMPGMWGMAKAASKITSWLLSNRSNPSFKRELKQVVQDTLNQQTSVAA